MIVCSPKNFIYDDKVNGAKSGQKENGSYISTVVVLAHDTDAFNYAAVKNAFENFKNDEYAVSVGKPTTDYGYNRVRVELCHLKPVLTDVLDADYNYEVAKVVLDALSAAGIKARAEFSNTYRTTHNNYAMRKPFDKNACPRNY